MVCFIARKAGRPYSPAGDCCPKKGRRGLGLPSGRMVAENSRPPGITQCSLSSSCEKFGVGEWGEVGANTPWPVVPFLSREVERVPSLLIDFCSSFEFRCHCFCKKKKKTQFGCTRSLVAALGIFDLGCSRQTVSCSVRDLVPWSGLEPGPLRRECGVLATGPPGKS